MDPGGIDPETLLRAVASCRGQISAVLAAEAVPGRALGLKGKWRSHMDMPLRGPLEFRRRRRHRAAADASDGRVLDDAIEVGCGPGHDCRPMVVEPMAMLVFRRQEVFRPQAYRLRFVEGRAAGRPVYVYFGCRCPSTVHNEDPDSAARMLCCQLGPDARSTPMRDSSSLHNSRRALRQFRCQVGDFRDALLAPVIIAACPAIAGRACRARRAAVRLLRPSPSRRRPAPADAHTGAGQQARAQAPKEPSGPAGGPRSSAGPEDGRRVPWPVGSRASPTRRCKAPCASRSSAP